MKIRGNIILTLVFSGVVSAWVFADNYSSVSKDEAEKVHLNGLDNLFKVSENLYRSEQPGRKDMQRLEGIGIKTVLNFRTLHNDRCEAKKTGIATRHLPIRTGKIAYDDVLAALKIIQQAEKPVLVHCWHGSDRTGCIVAAYRMVFQDWPKEKAIEEFQQEQFGYHEKWFPNILTLLETLDVQQLKMELNL